jgi:hypothetical protein
MHTVRVGDILRLRGAHRTVIDMRVGLTGKVLMFADGSHHTLRPGTYLSGHRPWPSP